MAVEKNRAESVRIDLTGLDPSVYDGWLEITVPAIEMPFDVLGDLATDMGYRGRDRDLFVETVSSAIHRFGILRILGDRI